MDNSFATNLIHEALKESREIGHGDTIYVSAVRRSATGSRSAHVYIVRKCNIWDVTLPVSILTGIRCNVHGELLVRGYGFSLADHVADALSQAMDWKITPRSL